MEKFIYTSNLSKRRDDLKKQILHDFNEYFCTELDYYSDIETYLNNSGAEYITKENRDTYFSNWQDEIDEINEINDIEYWCSDFEYGATLIHEDYFTEYVEELINDCGYINKDFPSWIELDWEATAKNVADDYSYIDYQGETYLFR